ncbi:hypothetical protein CRG98_006849 [Punica granatum]|uniref:Uncharacterized protein n=1 Tax=Punica granatum TaxID=22663 RepID=A0A2I0KWB5_PUNGR|nr:hypothetical protein CRG98_006849 [Punica granatum]
MSPGSWVAEGGLGRTGPNGPAGPNWAEIRWGWTGPSGPMRTRRGLAGPNDNGLLLLDWVAAAGLGCRLGCSREKERDGPGYCCVETSSKNRLWAGGEEKSRGRVPDQAEGVERTRKKSSCEPSLWRQTAGEKWPSKLRVSVRVRAPGFRGLVVNTRVINRKYFPHGWQNDDFAALKSVDQNWVLAIDK